METDYCIKLEDTYFDSYAPQTSGTINASFKDIVDLHIDGLPDRYIGYSMARLQGNRYLMCGYNYDACDYESYCVDGQTFTAERLELNNHQFSNCFVEGEYLLVARSRGSMIILKNLRDIGEIEFDAYYEYCKNNKPIFGRYTQQADHSVYTVDGNKCLYRIARYQRWQILQNTGEI